MNAAPPEMLILHWELITLKVSPPLSTILPPFIENVAESPEISTALELFTFILVLLTSIVPPLMILAAGEESPDVVIVSPSAVIVPPFEAAKALE